MEQSLGCYMKTGGTARLWLTVSLAIFSSLALPSAARCQAVAVAQVSGHVTDSSTGVVVGAQVIATEVGRGILHSATTDSNGSYVLSNLPIGPYRLQIKANGFKEYIQTG